MNARINRATRGAVAIAALGFLGLFVAGAHHYSTMLEAMMKNPLVQEWRGPANLKVGASPDCGGAPCWASPDADRAGSDWRAVDVPHVSLHDEFQSAATNDRVFYRFAIDLPASLRQCPDELSFSPNWVVHRRYDIFVDGTWVGSGHGATATGDIIYQKVVVSLPAAAKASGHALVVIAADVKPSDLGIQHLGKILIGPTTELKRLYIEAEFAMGSYYLVFLASEGAIFVFFSLIYLLAATRPGFGCFVAYAFLMASIHLAIGNFLEGIVPFEARIWLYFLAKGGSASVLAFYLRHVLWGKAAPPTAWRLAATLPTLLTVGLLILHQSGREWASIAVMHTATTGGLYAVIATFLATSIAIGGRANIERLGPLCAAGCYLGFLSWHIFLHPAQDFDYRPLADLGFFVYVAWLTIANFSLSQAKVGILRHNSRRLETLLSRFLGRGLARHLTIAGRADERTERDVTLMLFDIRYTNRHLHRHGQEALLKALDEWLSLLAATVALHGGEIHKIIGDKALIAWGLTGAPEPIRFASAAAALAIAMREASSDWNRERGERGSFPVAWASAIVSGRAFVGRVGGEKADERADFTVFGDVVNRAFALVQEAKTASVDVVIDRRSLMAAGDHLIYEQLNGRGAVLIAEVRDGAARIGHQRWGQEFQAMTRGGRVFSCGSNLEHFVPGDLIEDAEEEAA